MTNQEAFERMVTHLRKQGSRATMFKEGAMHCRYRAPDGKMCAVGCLIPDDEYEPGLEGRLAGVIADSVPALAGLSRYLLENMQHVHDARYVSEWEAKFAEIADVYGLKLPEAQS